MEFQKFSEMSKKKKIGIGCAIASVSAAAVLGGIVLFSTVNTPSTKAEQNDKFIMADWELTDVASRVSATDEEIRAVVERVLKENGFELTSEDGLNDAAISYIQQAMQERITESLTGYDASTTLSGEEITALETAIADDVYKILVEENKVATGTSGSSGTSANNNGSANGTNSGTTTAAKAGVDETTARLISQQIASSSVSGLTNELNSLKAQVAQAQNNIAALSEKYNSGKTTSSTDLSTIQNAINNLPKTGSTIDSESYTAIRNNMNRLVTSLNDFADETEQGLADINVLLEGKVSSEQLENLKTDYVTYVTEMNESLDTLKTSLQEVESTSNTSMADMESLIDDLQDRLGSSIDAVKAIDEKNLTDLKNSLVSQITANKKLSDEQAKILISQIGELSITSETSIENLRDQLTTYINDNQSIVSKAINDLSVDTTKGLDEIKTNLKAQIDNNKDLSDAYSAYLKGLIDSLDSTTASNMSSIKTYLQGEIDDTTAKLTNTTTTLEDTITSVNTRLGILESKNAEAASDLIQTIINQILSDPTLTDAEKAALIARIRNLELDDASSLEAIKEALAKIQQEITNHISEAISGLTVTPGADIDQTKTELKDQVNNNSNLTAEEKQILLEMIDNLDDSVAGDIAKIKAALTGMLSDISTKYNNSNDGVKTGDQHLQDELDKTSRKLSDLSDMTMQQIAELAAQTNLDLQGVIDMIGNNYTPTVAYRKGAYTIVDKKLYRCIENVTIPEEFNASHWKQVDLANELDDVRGMISDEFSTESDYEKGDVVIYDNKLYTCDVDTISSGSEFNPSQWVETTVNEVLNNKTPSIDIRLNSETNQPEWSARGADSWNPFSSHEGREATYVSLIGACTGTVSLGGHYDFLLVQPATTHDPMMQIIDTANAPAGGIYYSQILNLTDASGRGAGSCNYCGNYSYSIDIEEGTGNQVLTVARNTTVYGLDASSIDEIGVVAAGGSIDVTGYSTLVIDPQPGEGYATTFRQVFISPGSLGNNTLFYDYCHYYTASATATWAQPAWTNGSSTWTIDEETGTATFTSTIAATVYGVR